MLPIKVTIPSEDEDITGCVTRPRSFYLCCVPSFISVCVCACVHVCMWACGHVGMWACVLFPLSSFFLFSSSLLSWIIFVFIDWIDWIAFSYGLWFTFQMQYYEGTTALIQAAAAGRADIIYALIDRGADWDYENKYGITALIKAAQVGSTKAAEALSFDPFGNALCDMDRRNKKGKVCSAACTVRTEVRVGADERCTFVLASVVSSLSMSFPTILILLSSFPSPFRFFFSPLLSVLPEKTPEDYARENGRDLFLAWLGNARDKRDIARRPGLFTLHRLAAVGGVSGYMQERMDKIMKTPQKWKRYCSSVSVRSCVNGGSGIFSSSASSSSFLASSSGSPKMLLRP